MRNTTPGRQPLKRTLNTILLSAIILSVFAAPVAAKGQKGQKGHKGHRVGICHFTDDEGGRLIYVGKRAVAVHLAHGDLECDFRRRIRHLCVSINGVDFIQKGNTSCDSTPTTGVAPNIAIANGDGAEAYAGNGSNNTATAEGIGATACAGLSGLDNATATATADWATAIAGAVATGAGCIVDESITNEAYGESTTAEATAVGSMAVAGGIFIENSQVDGSLTNEAVAQSFTASATGDDAVASAGGIFFKDSHYGSVTNGMVSADAMTATASGLRSTAAAGSISVEGAEDIVEDLSNIAYTTAEVIADASGTDSIAAASSIIIE